nr:hypothetical protein [Tanacetum cinerariifolium]
MNYNLVSVAHQHISSAGFQDPFDVEKAREEVIQTYVLFSVWSAGSMNPQNNDKDALVDGKEHAASTSSYDLDMPALEDFTYSDDEDAIGAEADINNLESSIPVSPIPTTRIHRDHPISQIIGDISLTTQTRSMARAVKDQGFKDSDHPDKVYKVVKALYGLHQAPRACTPTDTEKPLLKDPDGKDVDVHTYRSMIGRKFNFSKYIFDSLVRNINSSSKFYMYHRFIQLIIQNQLDDLSTHTTKYIFPALTQKVFANMRRIGKGFSGVETPLFEEVVTTAALEDVLAAVLEDVHNESIPSPNLSTPPPPPS